MLVASHLFQLVHFGSFQVWQLFFPSFRVPDLRGRFEALNNVFRARHNWKFPLIDCRKMCIP
jgi:hypothetical protein